MPGDRPRELLDAEQRVTAGQAAFAEVIAHSGQVPGWQQLAVPPLSLQTTPQPPQWSGSAEMLVSQVPSGS